MRKLITLILTVSAILMASTAFAMPLCSKEGVKRGYACADASPSPSATPTPGPVADPNANWTTNQSATDVGAPIAVQAATPTMIVAGNSTPVDSQPWNLLLDGFLRFSNPDHYRFASVTIQMEIGGFYGTPETYSIPPDATVTTPFRMQRIHLDAAAVDYSVSAESDQGVLCIYENWGTTEHSTDQPPPSQD